MSKSLKEWGENSICACGQSRNLWNDWQEDHNNQQKEIDKLKEEKNEIKTYLKNALGTIDEMINTQSINWRIRVDQYIKNLEIKK